LCGIEWEFNDCDDATPINGWAKRWRGGIHDDGSCGWEAVTPPIAGKHIAACVEALGQAFNAAEAQADSRCGLHVHVDAGDLSWLDIYRLAAVFAHVEPVLFLLAGQNRLRNSQYCRPVAEQFKRALAAPDRKDAFLRLSGHAANYGRAAMFKSSMHKKDGGRYKALNLMPWLARVQRHRGRKGETPHSHKRVPDCTVEFRLHRNTLDAKRVAGWAKLCVAIVDWANRATDKELAEVTKLTALRALVAIAPGSRGWILKRVREWRNKTSFQKREGRAALGKVKRYVGFNPEAGWRTLAAS
jgi:hypothetical protein